MPRLIGKCRTSKQTLGYRATALEADASQTGIAFLSVCAELVRRHIWWEGRVIIISDPPRAWEDGFYRDEKEAISCGPVDITGGIVWDISVTVTATVVGAYFGWQSHGLVGALALGLVGLVVGGLLRSLSALLEMLT
jgi:hypothetical protein